MGLDAWPVPKVVLLTQTRDIVHVVYKEVVRHQVRRHERVQGRNSIEGEVRHVVPEHGRVDIEERIVGRGQNWLCVWLGACGRIG